MSPGLKMIDHYKYVLLCFLSLFFLIWRTSVGFSPHPLTNPPLHRNERVAMVMEVPRRIQRYRNITGREGEDYNRFDGDIIAAVDYWNHVFAEQQYPQAKPMEYNLVKAMIYIESRMGYYKPPPGSYPSYPDVMQVANPANPAIHTLRQEPGYQGNEFLSETEYGHLSCSYPSDNNYPHAETPEQSIFWGVRWLYHKVQDFGPQTLKPPYRRAWKTWRRAVYNYNGEGDKDYQDKVYNLFGTGLDPHGNQLW